MGDDFVDAAAVLVGQGRDGGLFVVVVGDEEGVDEHGLEAVSTRSLRDCRVAHFGQLSFCLPRSSERVTVAAM